MYGIGDGILYGVVHGIVPAAVVGRGENKLEPVGEPMRTASVTSREGETRRKEKNANVTKGTSEKKKVLPPSTWPQGHRMDIYVERIYITEP